MTRGRRPDPAAEKVAKGNPGKRRIVETVSLGPAGAVKPPSKLSRAAMAVWHAAAPDLERMNFLRQTDRNAFARYCDAVVRYWHVSEQLRKEGQTYTSQSAHGELKRINPLFLIEERLSRRLVELEDRFGLNPASRQQIMLRFSQMQPSLPLSGGRNGDAAQPGGEGHAPTGPMGVLSPPTRLN